MSSGARLSGSSEYNPPQFLIKAHRDALAKIECNQYGPTMVRWHRAAFRSKLMNAQGHLSFRQALSDCYSPILGRDLDPKKAIAVTTGATEGILATLMAFVDPGDEVIVMEPVFDLYKGDGV